MENQIVVPASETQFAGFIYWRNGEYQRSAIRYGATKQEVYDALPDLGFENSGCKYFVGTLQEVADMCESYGF